MGNIRTSLTMMVRLLLIVLLSALVATGCTPFKRTVVVTETRLIPVKVPEPMVKDCVVSPPPDRASYIDGDLNYRLGSMVRYNTRLVKDIKNCSSRMEVIRKWQDQQAETIRTDNDDGK